MNLMRGPKEEVIEEVPEDKEEFSRLKPLAAPTIPEEKGPPALPAPPPIREDSAKPEGGSASQHLPEESGETTTEDGTEGPKEEQLTLQDLLG